MNCGLRAARGEYVSRLDSDDVWLPEMLQTLVEALDCRPQVGVAYARGQAMDAGGRPQPHTNGMPQRFPGDDLRSLLYEDFTCNIATLARRSCFDRAGEYDESLPANEDWDMWLRIAENNRLAFVDRVLARYRWHDGNMTGAASPLFRLVLETRIRPLDKVFARADLPAAAMAMNRSPTRTSTCTAACAGCTSAASAIPGAISGVRCAWPRDRRRPSFGSPGSPSSGRFSGAPGPAAA